MHTEDNNSISVEKHKELFEYEMTEVLLGLKGVFADYSGKETLFAKAAVSEERLEIPNVILPNVTPEKFSFDLTIRCPNAEFSCPSEHTVLPIIMALPKRPPQVSKFRIVSESVSIRFPKCAPPERKDLVNTLNLKKKVVTVPVVPHVLEYSMPKLSIMPPIIRVPQTAAVSWLRMKKNTESNQQSIPIAELAKTLARLSVINECKASFSFPSLSVPSTRSVPNLKQGKLKMPTIPVVTVFPRYYPLSQGVKIENGWLGKQEDAIKKLNKISLRLEKQARGFVMPFHDSNQPTLTEKTSIAVPKLEIPQITIKPIRHSPLFNRAIPNLAIPTPPIISL